MKAAEQEDPVCGSESTNHPLHPPVLTERDSMELNWSKPPNNQEIRRYPQESASLMRDSYDFVPAYPARETFDTLLSTSQV